MSQSEFVWYDLATTDVEAAKSFYKTVVGWDAEAIPNMEYNVYHIGQARIAGVMPLPEHLRANNVPPHWNGYIGVADVDQEAERVKTEGGEIRHAATDIPGVGRFAVVADPQGAVFILFKGATDGPPTPAPMSAGRVGWHELYTKDWPAALRFYGGMFGWTPANTIDMGPMGTYQLFSYGGRDQGGIMNAPQGMHPGWLFYFVVDGIDLAARRVQDAGGLVFQGPQEVPGGAWIIQCRDPQGAAFALVSMGR